MHLLNLRLGEETKFRNVQWENKSKWKIAGRSKKIAKQVDHSKRSCQKSIRADNFYFLSAKMKLVQWCQAFIVFCLWKYAFLTDTRINKYDVLWAHQKHFPLSANSIFRLTFGALLFLLKTLSWKKIRSLNLFWFLSFYKQHFFSRLYLSRTIRSGKFVWNMVPSWVVNWGCMHIVVPIHCWVQAAFLGFYQ